MESQGRNCNFEKERGKRGITALKKRNWDFKIYRVKCFWTVFQESAASHCFQLCVCVGCSVLVPGGCATILTLRDRFPAGMIYLFVLATCPSGTVRTAFPGGVLVLVFLRWLWDPTRRDMYISQRPWQNSPPRKVVDCGLKGMTWMFIKCFWGAWSSIFSVCACVKRNLRKRKEFS